MDLRKLKKLIDLVQESGIAELEITEGEEKVKIVKGGAVTVAQPTMMMAAPMESPPAPPTDAAGGDPDAIPQSAPATPPGRGGTRRGVGAGRPGRTRREGADGGHLL